MMRKTVFSYLCFYQEAADGLSRALGPRWDKKALEVSTGHQLKQLATPPSLTSQNDYCQTVRSSQISDLQLCRQADANRKTRALLKAQTVIFDIFSATMLLQAVAIQVLHC